MIELAVYNTEGQEIESLKVDESALGGVVRYSLLKQAIIMYQDNKRVGTAETKSRGMVAARPENSIGKNILALPGWNEGLANVSVVELLSLRLPEISANGCLKSKED